MSPNIGKKRERIFNRAKDQIHDGREFERKLKAYESVVNDAISATKTDNETEFINNIASDSD